jgi:syntaxin-binding protein 1
MAPKIKKKAEDYSYEVSRYAPRIKAILNDSVAGVLDTSSFSSVKGSNIGNASAPSSAKAAPVSLRQKTAVSNPMSAPNSASTSSVPSRSVVLFVIGGVTYSEIRSAYEVADSTKREVYIGKHKFIIIRGLFYFLGGTHILNPRLFIENLRTIQ